MELPPLSALDAIFGDLVYELRPDLAQLAELRREGACVGKPTEWFFPPRGGDKSTSHAAAAREVCHRCPVQAGCLAYALEHRERNGIWGGTAEKDRRPLQRLRRRGWSIEAVVAVALDDPANVEQLAS